MTNSCAPQSSWQKVTANSIYSDEVVTGYLKPNGDIVDLFRMIGRSTWRTLIGRDEIRSLTIPTPRTTY